MKRRLYWQETLGGRKAGMERNQIIVAYHVKAEGVVELGEELEDIKRVKPEKLEPWPFATGLAVHDWLVKEGYKDKT